MQHFQLDEANTLGFKFNLKNPKAGNYTVVVTPAGLRPVTKKLIISK